METAGAGPLPKRLPTPAFVVKNLAIVRVNLDIGALKMSVNLTWTTPTTRVDGSALTPSEIALTHVRRNGTSIGTPTAVEGAMAFSDTAPIVGANTYTVDTTTTDGLVSAPSNAVIVTVASTSLPSPVGDLAGVPA